MQKFKRQTPVFLKLFLILGFYYVSPAQAKKFVLTTTPTLADIARFIGGPLIKIESIIGGPQDPHYLSAKPSYMLKARRADIFILNGLDLEIGWAPNVILGARNPKILKGAVGYLDASQFIEPINVVEGKIDRFQGDIHPSGNPHFMIDPVNAVKVAQGFAQKFSLLDPESQQYYMKRSDQFKANINQKLKLWRERINQSKIKKIITYHSSFDYIIRRFGLELVATIEVKPGIPPTAKHILYIRNLIKDQKISCVLAVNFFSKKYY